MTFAALSDPTRRSIVNRLTAGPATVVELAAPFSISQQAISKHLAYLENARLIERQREGRQNFCALKPATIRDVADWAEGYRRVLGGELPTARCPARRDEVGKETFLEVSETCSEETQKNMNLSDTFKVTTPGEREIVMARDFDAPAEMIFDALTKCFVS